MWTYYSTGNISFMYISIIVRFTRNIKTQGNLLKRGVFFFFANLRVLNSCVVIVWCLSRVHFHINGNNFEIIADTMFSNRSSVYVYVVKFFLNIFFHSKTLGIMSTFGREEVAVIQVDYKCHRWRPVINHGFKLNL